MTLTVQSLNFAKQPKQQDQTDDSEALITSTRGDRITLGTLVQMPMPALI